MLEIKTIFSLKNSKKILKFAVWQNSKQHISVRTVVRNIRNGRGSAKIAENGTL